MEKSQLELDHVYCFCAPPATKEVETATRAGFALTAGTKHTGQGTANRCIIFRENYLEFIFVDSPADVRSDPTHLLERANWKSSGASPFGICLRGNLSAADKEKFWEYKPPYWPEGSIFIFNAAKNLASIPMIFVIPSSVRPADRPKFAPALFAHKSQANGMTELELTGPGYAWPELLQVNGISFVGSKQHHMKVITDGRMEEEFAFNEVLSLQAKG